MRKLATETYTVRIGPTAWRQLGVVPSDTFTRIKNELYELAENSERLPVKDGVVLPGPLALIVGEYMAVYEVDTARLTLTLMEVAKRLPEKA